MENATKALLIAAGMLFAIALVAMVAFMFIQFNSYYSSKQDSATVEQITEFNNQFEAYNRDDVTGFELVSLINKVINYNAYNTVGDENVQFNNEDKSFQTMTITVTIKSDLQGELFTKDTYTASYKNTNTDLDEIIDEMRELENTYGANILTKLVSNVDNLSEFGGDGSKDIKQVLGKDLALDDLTRDDILKYGDYIDFKRAEFKCTSTDYNNNTGRIVGLEFE